jgi:hypothetical protein
MEKNDESITEGPIITFSLFIVSRRQFSYFGVTNKMSPKLKAFREILIVGISLIVLAKSGEGTKNAISKGFHVP